MKLKNIYILIFVILFTGAGSIAQVTEKIFLSGTGNDDTVDWDFYCTAGANSGKWATIPVPSCWELQGFGKYDYGFAKDSVRGREKGMYRHVFKMPLSWKGKVVNIVFEGAMTDAEVKVNGQSAGAIHQGAFYSFRYDISKLITYDSDNLLEVTVSKHSADQSVNEAERKADFWIFGGIFRPVFLEALPPVHIKNIAIDAGADMNFKLVANITGAASSRLTAQVYAPGGKKTGPLMTGDGRKGAVTVSGKIPGAKLWSPEFPNLYEVELTLYNGPIAVHKLRQRFGFRTVEVKQRDGIYVNGVKVKMKGVNRHSFWPNSGRTTSKAISIADVQLIKSMNMNAVRMSHYPPDGHFLDVCDSLGLFVMDELAGWHGHYSTVAGTKLVKEMLEHDGNHPSIIFWANGNEGGHNLELDHLFPEQDIQKRPVIHPWQLFGGFDTQHYREFNYGIGNYENGREIVMPTEFLHGQFDGGHGAGLDDYWEKMWHNPLSAGGFLWDFADQGVVRRDKNDSLDTDKNRGADGIVGPYHEKEGSYFTIKEVWSPVYVERREVAPGFDGIFNIENRYHYTNINQCSFSWQLKDIVAGKTIHGNAIAPAVLPAQKGQLKLILPANWASFNVLYLSAFGPDKKELFTWSFPISRPAEITRNTIRLTGDADVKLNEQDSLYIIYAGNNIFSINKNNGLLQQVKNNGTVLPFNNGPVLQEGVNNFTGLSAVFDGKNLVIRSKFDRKNHYNVLQWTIYPSGLLKMEVNYFPAAYFTKMVGVNFSFPETAIKGVEYMGNGPYRVWKNRLKGNAFGVWKKEYNSTETGETWQYPEFKGYHSNMYWCKFITKGQSFTVYTDNEDLFFRLFTPAWKTDQWHNYEPTFPSGDISFMQGISSIGTKTQRAETTGPMGEPNIYYDYEKDPGRYRNITLYFDFDPQ